MAQFIEVDGSTFPYKIVDLETTQKSIGGYLEVVFLGGEDILIIDEEGKLKGLSINRRATDLTRGVLAHDDLIVGPAILTTKDEFDNGSDEDFEGVPIITKPAVQQELDLDLKSEKTWTKEEIKTKIFEDQKWLERGILAIYRLQTNEEKNTGDTLENNGVGYSGADAHYMSYVASYLLSGRHLSGKHLDNCRKKMQKYAGQLCKIANREI